MSQQYIAAIEGLVAERGEKIGDFWELTLTTQDILDRVGVEEVNWSHHKMAKQVVERGYPMRWDTVEQEIDGTYRVVGQTAAPVVESIGLNGENGWSIQIKTRSK